MLLIVLAPYSAPDDGDSGIDHDETQLSTLLGSLEIISLLYFSSYYPITKGQIIMFIISPLGRCIGEYILDSSI